MAKAKKTKKGGGFFADVYPDEVLAAIIGAKERPRTQVTKALWAYIHKHGLQNTKNKRMIDSGDDEAFKEFAGGKKQISMFDMAKFVSKHVSK